MSAHHAPLRIMLSLILALWAVASAQRDSLVRVAVGPPGSSAEAIGRSAVALLGDGVPGVRSLEVPTSGSVDTIQRVVARELDIGLAYGGDAFFAFHGLAEFDVDEESVDELRVVGFAYVALSHLIVRAEAPYARLADLDGARVAVGAPGSGDATATERLFRQVGAVASITPVYVGGDEAIRLLEAGRVDAIHALVGVDGDAFVPLLASGAVRVIDTMEAAGSAGFFARFPFYAAEICDACVAASAATTWGDAVVWVTRAALGEDDVYTWTAALYGETGVGARAVAPPGGQNAARLEDALRGVDVPLHAGAARYWRERGIEIPDHLLPVPRRTAR